MSVMKKIDEFLWQGSYGNTVYMSYNVSDMTFLAIKIILFIYMTFCFVLQQLTWDQEYFTQYVYLTLWGFYLSYTYFLLSIIYNIHVYYKKKQSSSFQPSFRFLPKFINILFEIVFSLELTITIIYWGIVFPNRENDSIGKILTTSQFHGGILITLWIENIFNGIQFRKSHIVPFSILSFFYCLVNCIYVLTADKEIYPGLDWVSVMSYLELLAAGTLSLVHYFVGFYFYKKVKKEKLGLKIEKHYHASSLDEEEEDRDQIQDQHYQKAKQNRSLIQSLIQEENKSIQSQNFV